MKPRIQQLTGVLSDSGSLILTGSLFATQGFTGSLQGTASHALTASFSPNAVSSSYALSSSFVQSSLSSSYALTASFALNGGGGTVNTSSLVTTSSFNSFTSSYNTGSFTGSFTGSLLGTVSFSVSSSYALSSSLSISSSRAVSSSFATTSSFSVSSSYALSSSYSLSSSYAVSASIAISASFAPTNTTGSFTGSFTGSLLGTASYANNALSSSFALTASFALNGGGGNINTGSFVTTSSFNAFTSSYNTGSFTGSFIGIATTASNTILQNQIITNQTVGALTSGTTLSTGTGLESILRTMLVTYIPPTLSSLVMRNGGSNISTAARDVGDSFTVNTASFSAAADNPTSIFPISSSWTGSGADIGTQTFYFGDNVLSSSNVRSIGGNYVINRATTNGTVTFTVNGRRSDTGAAISGTTTSISFQWRNYLSASPTTPTDNATAQTVVNASVTSTLDTDRAWTATCTAANNILGNFTYIIYPASYGNLSNIVQNGALSVLTAFTNLGDFTVTNAFGASILVRIYKSNSDKAFASGTTLAIS